MKLHSKTNRSSTCGTLEKGETGIDLEDVSFISKILRDDMYSDKIMAVVREYCTNASDANLVYAKEKGIKQKPVLLTIPTALNPVFKVRDFGHGMTKEDVLTNYFKYGKSTKRGRDQVNGFFGIGCKVGWAYGDTFLVHSYNGGFKRTYAATLGSDPAGESYLISEIPSKETGMEIEINVKNSDIEIFKTKIKEVGKYLSITPETNCSFEIPSYKDEAEQLVEGVYIESNYSYAKEIFAVMGGVKYPVSQNLFHEGVTLSDDEYRKIDKLFSKRLIIEFDIDKSPLVMHPSREKISYEKQTYASLKSRLLDVCKKVASQEEFNFKNAKTAEEAHRIYNNSMFLDKKQKWNGVEFDLVGSSLDCQQDVRKFMLDDGEVKGRLFNSSRSWINDTISTNHLSGGVLKIVVKKKDEKGALAPKARSILTEVDTKCNSVIFVDEDKMPPSLSSARKVFKNSFLNFADVENKRPESTSQSSSGSVNRKRFNTKFQILRPSYVSSGGTIWSNCWRESTDDCFGKENIYVEINRNKPVKYSADQINFTYNACSIIKRSFVIIGVKSSDVKSISKDKSWIELSDYIKQNKNTIVKSLSEKERLLRSINLSSDTRHILSFAKVDFPKNTFREGLDKNSKPQFMSHRDSDLVNISNMIGFDCEKTAMKFANELQKEYEKTLAKHPVLSYISWSWNPDYDEIRNAVSKSC